MRQLLLVPAALAAAACSANTPTGTASARVSVRLRTDGGVSAGRNSVLVLSADGRTTVLTASVNGDGDITLPDGGTYLVRVLPRSSEFLYSEQLQATVSVAPGDRLPITFTLYRRGAEAPLPVIERPNG